MRCEEFSQLKELYLQGKINGNQEKAVEEHLVNCPQCQQLFDQWLTESEIEQRHYGFKDIKNVEKNNQALELDEKKQEKILRKAKYKSRVSMAISLVLIFILANIAGSLLSSLFFTAGGENSRIYKSHKTTALLIEATFPNVTMPASTQMGVFSGAGFGHSSIHIKPYFAAQSSFAMQKQIGKDKYIIGYLEQNHFFTARTTNWRWQDGYHSEYLHFYHPDAIAAIRKDEASSDIDFYQETWETLEMLPAGTVGELALSFDQTHTIEEIMLMLAEYDLVITWYAIETGMENDPIHPEGVTRPPSVFDGVWGVPHMSSTMLRSQNTPIHSLDGSVREKHFIESLEFLLANHSLAKRIHRGGELHLSDRHAYVQENGVKAYGVVVTGPTKELLRLQELPGTYSPTLGEIKLWNWFSRNFSGTMY